MIDYGAIRDVLRAGIWQHMRVFFVDLENGDPRPPHPFISHKFITPYMEESGYEINDEDTLIRESQLTMTLSLTVYATSKTEALNIAHQLRQWFQFYGYEYMVEHGLVVVTIEGLEDRTTFLETDYEHRVGFDVVLRTVDRVERKIDTIERVELNDEMMGG